jgi:ferredoxin
MCSICLVNLRKEANGTICLRDTSDHLLDAVRREGRVSRACGRPDSVAASGATPPPDRFER